MLSYGHQAKYYIQTHFEQVKSQSVTEQQTRTISYEWRHDIFTFTIPACILVVCINQMNQHESFCSGDVIFVKPICILNQRLCSSNLHAIFEFKSNGSILFWYHRIRGVGKHFWGPSIPTSLLKQVPCISLQ